MKNLILLIIAMTFAMQCFAIAQNVGINEDSSVPNPSAMLDVKSTTKGFLPPRMTLEQRCSVTAVEGLMIYNTTTKKINVYDGTEWTNMDGTSAALTIGTTAMGGKVAYIFRSGDPGYVAGQTHGLIAAPSDQSSGIQWYNGSYTTTGATATAIGTGNANTNAIVSNQGEGSYAAKLCYDLNLGGYSDWYLPSVGELGKLYLNKDAIGGFSTDVYWSSSEKNNNNFAWYVYFATGDIYNLNKASTNSVRAVRTF